LPILLKYIINLHTDLTAKSTADLSTYLLAASVFLFAASVFLFVSSVFYLPLFVF